MSYKVRWDIDIEEASSPQEAAEIALRIQRDQYSDATIFEVTSEDGTIEVVDLLLKDLEGLI